MDPIASALSTLIEVLSNGLSSSIADRMGTEIKTVTVKHQGIDIPYAYQTWKIKKDSVCHTYIQHTGQYAQCTQAAQSLFSELCTYLGRQQSLDWKSQRFKSMYCLASVEYKPMVATIMASSNTDPLDESRIACNNAVAAVMGSSDPVLVQERNVACGKYQRLKEGGNGEK